MLQVSVLMQAEWPAAAAYPKDPKSLGAKLNKLLAPNPVSLMSPGRDREKHRDKGASPPSKQPCGEHEHYQALKTRTDDADTENEQTFISTLVGVSPGQVRAGSGSPEPGQVRAGSG